MPAQASANSRHRGPDDLLQLRGLACWAHLRRDLHDVLTATKSEVARQALALARIL
ncbi:MAG: IS66 family transposase [Alkalilacustris sp.]